MRVKKYLADDFQTAILKAKNEMGRDAIILNSRQINKKGFMGLFKKSQVEITVALDDDLRLESDNLRRTAPVFPTNNQKSFAVGEVSPQENQLLLEMSRVQELMADIKNKMYEVEMLKGFNESVQDFYNLLLKNQVDKDIALKIAHSVETRLPGEKCADSNWVRDVCLHTLQDYINEVKPIKADGTKRPQIIVMVGPTGVGKTTTIAKLAANFTFVEFQKVAFITLDTYRVSAADQLRTFAEIIGIPIKVVFSPADLDEAIKGFKDCDLIFIDTAGRSPYNQEQMHELAQFLDVAQPDETILVLSVNTESNDLINIYERFSRVNIDKLIFTKFDETICYGQLLNVFNKIDKPVAYITNGQSVPEDIVVPDAQHIAGMMLGKDEVI
ncbi:Signal-recognition particle (SRP)-type GTPase [Syntrophomonas zehnderi OL-4]|uniref:Flagellar biosynthesis protein FlhF n=1 Tax=Syntrophomonas zehnderi OL-4 TaxID=690567 RepID=A0A0E4GBX0_9FIRM|nr:flagellar biosynthesis protein FlhF [Syntrophomonas zehnderi]CFX65941.1 Signal-recognition particle (SRP)-type GTPase [Syntrophomonas zehnderi OL-4]